MCWLGSPNLGVIRFTLLLSARPAALLLKPALTAGAFPLEGLADKKWRVGYKGRHSRVARPLRAVRDAGPPPPPRGSTRPWAGTTESRGPATARPVPASPTGSARALHTYAHLRVAVVLGRWARGVGRGSATGPAAAPAPVAGAHPVGPPLPTKAARPQRDGRRRSRLPGLRPTRTRTLRACSAPRSSAAARSARRGRNDLRRRGAAPVRRRGGGHGGAAGFRPRPCSVWCPERSDRRIGRSTSLWISTYIQPSWKSSARSRPGRRGVRACDVTARSLISRLLFDWFR